MGFVCTRCGETHEDLAAWTYKKPDPWLGLTELQKAAGKCDDDLCRTDDGHFFVRAVLELPLIGGPQTTFEFGVWGSLSEVNFYRYVESFDDDDQSKLGSMFSYLSNEVRGFQDSFALQADMEPRDDRLRPVLLLHATDHPLAIAQRDGISFEKVLDIVHQD